MMRVAGPALEARAHSRFQTVAPGVGDERGLALEDVDELVLLRVGVPKGREAPGERRVRLIPKFVSPNSVAERSLRPARDPGCEGFRVVRWLLRAGASAAKRAIGGLAVSDILAVSQFEFQVLCRFLDAGGAKPLGTLGEPASKKRRGTKSRGVWGRVGSQRYGDLIFAPIMTVGAKLAPGGLDRVRKGSWKRALGISVAAWGVSTGGRIVDWRGFAERDRRRRRASAAERESGGARRRSGS